ncbi:MAG TPA: ATP-grasp domain-containing protein [Streptosporangiaceae bacterium]|nr:ATP-grasp domain-containing protein [Streptosporangiaceae bacterium]
MQRLVVVGVGRRAPFREYALAAMARRADLVLVDSHEPTWPKRYISSSYLIEEPGLEAMLSAGRQALGIEKAAGIMTYDDRYTVAAAQLAEEARLPGAGLAATTACKDKWQTRKNLNAARLGPVPARLVHSADQALAAASEIGLPVVMKPRALAASKGVIKVETLAQARHGFATAAAATVTEPVFDAPGVLVEECVEGEEFSIDCVVYRGEVTPVFVARKIVGPEPAYEEIGHVVTTEGIDLLPDGTKFLQEIHEALGYRDGITHAELRVSPSGYRIMEVNPRLGGDMIPYLGYLASGIDLAGAAADVALGRRPALHQTRARAAAVSFICPDHDLIFQSIEIPAQVRDDPRVERIVPLVSQGDVLRLPPAGYLSRIAIVITTGATAGACVEAMDATLAKITIRSSPAGPVG